MTALNQAFVSEAYDRLMAVQARAASATFVGALAVPVTDLRAARERLGLTQAALAERLGTDAPRLSQIENGKPMPPWLDLALRTLLAFEAMK